MLFWCFQASNRVVVQQVVRPSCHVHRDPQQGHPGLHHAHSPQDDSFNHTQRKGINCMDIFLITKISNASFQAFKIYI